MHASVRRSSRLVSASTSQVTATIANRTTVTTAATDASPPTLGTGRNAKRPRSASFSDLTDLSDEAPTPAKKPKQARKPAKPKTIVYDIRDFPARVDCRWKIGPHVSAAGGVENAVLNAASIGATAFALFLKSQRKWTAPPLSQDSIDAFKARIQEFSYDCKHILPHGNYLVNLGNPDADKREKSYQCFVDELKRCEQLGLPLFNFHPGSTVGQATPSESLRHIADCINRAHLETQRVVVVIENMAGAGNVLGSKFSEIQEIISNVKDKARVGVCLDTCHLFAAGYDIRTNEEWNATMHRFDDEIGLQYLRGMHMNDSKAELGSKKDRHENIGQGHLGLAAFAHILNDPRTQDIPLILETAAHDETSTSKAKWTQGEGWDVWRKEIEVLHRVAGMRGTVDGASSGREDGSEVARLGRWSEEIRSVVERVVGEEGRAGKAKGAAKVNGKGKGKRGKKVQVQEDDADTDSCMSDA